MGEQWVACSVGISYAIRKLHSPARSAGGCERWSCVLRRSGASSSTARRERLGYWLGSAASAIPGAAVERFFEGLGLVELDWCKQEWRPDAEAGAASPALWCGAGRKT